MNIISPEFSFLDFNYIDNDVCDNQSVASLPVCNDLSIKAQFSIDSETETQTTQLDNNETETIKQTPT